MRLNKKGDFNAVTGIIMALLIIVVLASAWNVISKTLTKSYDKEGCRQSVLQNSFRITVGGTELIQPFKELNCPTITEKVDKVDNDRVFRVLANNLYDCWDKFGQGRIKFLDPQTKDYCIICSRIEFQGEAKGRKIPGFLEFLATKKIADEKGLQYSNLTYMEFLTPYQTKEGLLDKFENIKEDNINTNFDYATMFILYKTQNEGRLELGSKAFIIGCLGAAIGTGIVFVAAGPAAIPFGAVFGSACTTSAVAGVGGAYIFGSDRSAEWGARTILVPYQDISKLGCDSLQ